VVRRSPPAPRKRGPPGARLDRLILDTSVLVRAERDARGLQALIPDDADVAITPITVAELLVGVEAATGRRRALRKAFVEDLISVIPIQPYDLEVARAHAAILAATRSTGRTRGAHDLIIAATALVGSRSVVTADRIGFEDLPGVDVRSGS
jgi:tRNA(fMet)-specific endonuclease VapC